MAAVSIDDVLKQNEALITQYYESSQPEIQTLVHDRLEQALAQLSVSQLHNQWPINLQLVDGADNEPYRSTTIGDAALEHIQQLVQKLTAEGVIPTARILDAYLQLRSAVPANAVADYSKLAAEPWQLSAPFNNGIVSIEKQISSGTAQGVVYSVDLLPNKSLHTVDLSKSPLQIPISINAVLKKAPIVSPDVWLMYVALVQLSEIQKYWTQLKLGIPTGGAQPKKSAGPDDEDSPPVPGVPQRRRPGPGAENLIAQRAILLNRAEQIIRTAKLPATYWVGLDGREADVFYEGAANALLSNYLIPAMQNLNNASYVDAIVTFFGSLMAEYNLSPFFPLLYATFRAVDENFFDETTQKALGPSVRHIPIQGIIEQRLDGSLKDLLTAGQTPWLFVPNGQTKSNSMYTSQSATPSTFDGRRLISVLAQLVFGLANAQRLFGFVHNDLHWQNVMYEDVDEETVIYYTDGKTVWAIRTKGKWIRLIDCGRSKSTINGTEFYSDETLQVASNWNFRGANNDLLRIISVMLLPYLSTTYDVYDPTSPEAATDMKRFLSHVIECPKNNGTLLDNVQTCLEDNRRARQGDKNAKLFPVRSAGAVNNRGGRTDGHVATMRDCYRDEFSVGPFTTTSPCSNAIPSENIKFFKSLIVSPDSVPKDAVIYPL